MRWLMNVVKALLVLLLLLAGIGLLLPRQRHVERRLIIQAPVTQIWPLLADPKHWVEWSPWYSRDPAVKLNYSSAVVGVGADWTWDSVTLGHGRMQFVQADEPRQLDYRLQLKDQDMNSSATGSFKLEVLNIGVRVIWSLDTDLGWNPAMRWFGLGMERMVGADFDDGLMRLSQAAAQAR
ncbi:MAG: SRPBCC family protein [Leptothrix sp. (in: b-proteobacteria)]